MNIQKSKLFLAGPLGSCYHFLSSANRAKAVSNSSPENHRPAFMTPTRVCVRLMSSKGLPLSKTRSARNPAAISSSFSSQDPSQCLPIANVPFCGAAYPGCNRVTKANDINTILSLPHRVIILIFHDEMYIVKAPCYRIIQRLQALRSNVPMAI